MSNIGIDNRIDLNNPIFVHYVNKINGNTLKSHQAFQQEVEQISRIMNRIENITYWVVPAEYTKIECIFDGYNCSKYKVETLLNVLNNSKTKDEVISKLRDIIINDLSVE